MLFSSPLLSLSPSPPLSSCIWKKKRADLILKNVRITLEQVRETYSTQKNEPNQEHTKKEKRLALFSALPCRSCILCWRNCCVLSSGFASACCVGGWSLAKHSKAPMTCSCVCSCSPLTSCSSSSGMPSSHTVSGMKKKRRSEWLWPQASMTISQPYGNTAHLSLKQACFHLNRATMRKFQQHCLLH